MFVSFYNDFQFTPKLFYFFEDPKIQSLFNGKTDLIHKEFAANFHFTSFFTFGLPIKPPTKGFTIKWRILKKYGENGIIKNTIKALTRSNESLYMNIVLKIFTPFFKF